MISEEEVKHIAELARLELAGTEIKKMQKDLTAILDYFELLKKAPQSKNFKENFYRGASSLRKDESRKSGLADELLAASPDKKDDYVKVKAIL